MFGAKEKVSYIQADSLFQKYIDALPEMKKQVSSQQLYLELKNSYPKQISVSHFNKVRFYSKFRQTEVQDENDYALMFEEMARFNRLSQKLFGMRFKSEKDFYFKQ